MFDLLCLMGFVIVFVIVLTVAWLFEHSGNGRAARSSAAAKSSRSPGLGYSPGRGWQSQSPAQRLWSYQSRYYPQSEHDFDELVDELMWEGYSRAEAEWEADARLEALERERDLLPSGYTIEEYKRYGATDLDIEFWGLDQPGAPPPDEAGWVVWGMADEMDW